VTSLVLELRPGELMLVNGAQIRFSAKTRVELTAHARFLFGKQVMLPEQATTSAKRLYLALQAAYVGVDQERARGLAAARAAAALVEVDGSSRQIVARAMSHADADEYFPALKLLRRLIDDEGRLAA
jgi:flagellar biosynthesis repressor protein FlbT